MGCIFSSNNNKLRDDKNLRANNECDRIEEKEKAREESIVLGKRRESKSGINSMMSSKSAVAASNNNNATLRLWTQADTIRKRSEKQKQCQLRQSAGSFFAMLIHGRHGIQSVKVNAINCDEHGGDLVGNGGVNTASSAALLATARKQQRISVGNEEASFRLVLANPDNHYYPRRPLNHHEQLAAITNGSGSVVDLPMQSRPVDNLVEPRTITFNPSSGQQRAQVVSSPSSSPPIGLIAIGTSHLQVPQARVRRSSATSKSAKRSPSPPASTGRLKKLNESLDDEDGANSDSKNSLVVQQQQQTSYAVDIGADAVASPIEASKRSSSPSGCKSPIPANPIVAASSRPTMNQHYQQPPSSPVLMVSSTLPANTSLADGDENSTDKRNKRVGAVGYDEDDDTILFTTVQQLCFEIIGRGLLSEMPFLHNTNQQQQHYHQGKVICLFVFGSQGSGKGEIAYELVEHSNLLKKCEPVICERNNSDGEDCPLYHHIDVGAIIVANIDARIREYNRLVSQTTRARRKQLALTNPIQDQDDQQKHQFSSKANCASESVETDDQSELNETEDGGAAIYYDEDGSNSQFSYQDNESTSRNPSISSDFSNCQQQFAKSSSIKLDTELKAEKKGGQRRVEEDPRNGTMIIDDFNLITLSTKQRSILQLKLMKYFNSITSKWVFDLIQAEIDKLESHLKQRIKSNIKKIDQHQSQRKMRDRVYLITLVPNQLSLFKSCLFLHQNLLLKDLKYPFWAIKFERRTNLKLVSKERGVSSSDNNDSSTTKLQQPPRESSPSSFLSLSPIKQLAGLRLPILSIGGGFKGIDSKKAVAKGIKERPSKNSGNDGADDGSSFRAGEKVGPKFNDNFAQQFKNMNRLLAVRYNPTRDYKYKHHDEDDDNAAVDREEGGENEIENGDDDDQEGDDERQENYLRTRPKRINCSTSITGLSKGPSQHLNSAANQFLDYHYESNNQQQQQSPRIFGDLNPSRRVLSCSMQNLLSMSPAESDRSNSSISEEKHQRLSLSLSHPNDQSQQLSANYSQCSLLSSTPSCSLVSISSGNCNCNNNTDRLHSAASPEHLDGRHSTTFAGSLRPPSSRNQSGASIIKWAVELELFDSLKDPSPIDHGEQRARSASNRWRTNNDAFADNSTTSNDLLPIANNSSQGGHHWSSKNNCSKAILFHEPKSVAATAPTTSSAREGGGSKSSSRFFAGSGAAQNHQHRDGERSASEQPYQLVPVRIAYENGQSQIVFEFKRVNPPQAKLGAQADLAHLVGLIYQACQQVASDCENWLYDSIERYLRKTQATHNGDPSEPQHHHRHHYHHILNFSLANHRKRHSISSGHAAVSAGSQGRLQHHGGFIAAPAGDEQLLSAAHAQHLHPALIVHTIRLDVSQLRLAQSAGAGSSSGSSPSACSMAAPAATLEANLREPPAQQLVPILVLNGSQVEPTVATAGGGRPLSAVADKSQQDSRARPSSSRSALSGGCSPTTATRPPRRHVQFRLSEAPESAAAAAARASTSCLGKSVWQKEELAALKPQHRHWIGESLFASAGRDNSARKLLDLVSALVKQQLAASIQV